MTRKTKSHLYTAVIVFSLSWFVALGAILVSSLDWAPTP